MRYLGIFLCAALGIGAGSPDKADKRSSHGRRSVEVMNSHRHKLSKRRRSRDRKSCGSKVYSLLSDGTFERGLSAFQVYYHEGVGGAAEVNGDLSVRIDDKSSERYKVQLLHNISINEGETYSLCYDAKASSRRKMMVDIDSGPTAYASLSGQQFIKRIGRRYKHIKFTFTAQQTDPDARVAFNLGLEDADVHLDNIGLYPGKKCGTPTPEPPDPDLEPDPYEPGQGDPNFHIYLAFGQSNMEGTGVYTPEDNLNNPRAQVFHNFGCANLGRDYGVWYSAEPPYFGCWGGYGVADGFVEALLDQSPSTVTIGLVPAAIGGSDIALWEKGAPIGRGNIGTEKIPPQFAGGYDWLLDLARKATETGVIKGIIFHQGETNTANPQWKYQVQQIVSDLKADLHLGSIPFLAGELLHVSEGGCCGIHNPEINQLPDLIPNAHVISAGGLEGADVAHFTRESYKAFGVRYAETMAKLVYPPSPSELLSVCGAPTDDPNAPSFTKDFRLTGRFGASNDRVCYTWPGSSMAFRFSGTSASLELQNDARLRFQVEVDGNRNDLWVEPGLQSYILASDLEDGVHTVKLTRLTESFTAVSSLVAAPSVQGELLAPPPAPERTLLFLGDSITAGYGVEGADQTCSYAHETSHPLKAYAGLTAEALGADAHLIAWSGIGLWRSYGEETPVSPTMQVRQGLTLANETQAIWDAARFQPEAVIVNLGTNDFWNGDGGQYEQALAGFLAQLMVDYPTGPIYLVISPMLSGAVREGQASILRAREGGRIKVLDLGLNLASNGFGCDYHPNIVTQQQMADRLIEVLKQDLGW